MRRRSASASFGFVRGTTFSYPLFIGQSGLELWLPGEDYPRRGSGLVIAGSSLDLDAFQVHVAIFRWRLDGREGIGAYELMVRVVPPVAA